MFYVWHKVLLPFFSYPQTKWRHLIMPTEKSEHQATENPLGDNRVPARFDATPDTVESILARYGRELAQ